MNEPKIDSINAQPIISSFVDTNPKNKTKGAYSLDPLVPYQYPLNIKLFMLTGIVFAVCNYFHFFMYELSHIKQLQRDIDSIQECFNHNYESDAIEIITKLTMKYPTANQLHIHLAKICFSQPNLTPSIFYAGYNALVEKTIDRDELMSLINDLPNFYQNIIIQAWNASVKGPFNKILEKPDDYGTGDVMTGDYNNDYIHSS